MCFKETCILKHFQISAFAGVWFFLFFLPFPTLKWKMLQYERGNIIEILVKKNTDLCLLPSLILKVFWGKKVCSLLVLNIFKLNYTDLSLTAKKMLLCEERIFVRSMCASWLLAGVLLRFLLWLCV